MISPDVHIAQASQVGFYLQSGEPGLNNEVSNLKLWGCGGGLVLDSNFDDHFSGGLVSNLHLEACGQKTNWPSWIFRQYPLYHQAGAWYVSHGAVLLPGDLQLPPFRPDGLPWRVPAYGVGMVSSSGRLIVDKVRFPTFSSGLFTTYNSLLPTFRHCPEVNPFGSRQVAVPPSGTAVGADCMDRMFNVTVGARACSMAIQNGPTVTPAYTATPTWVVEGE